MRKKILNIYLSVSSSDYFNYHNHGVIYSRLNSSKNTSVLDAFDKIEKRLRFRQKPN
jgi:hypothetical protein